MRSEANGTSPSFKNMQGKAAIIAVVALLAVAAAVFFLMKPPAPTAAPEQAAITQQTAPAETSQETSADTGTETAASIDPAVIVQHNEETAAAEVEAEHAATEERLAEETETPANVVETAEAPAVTEDAEEVENLLSAPKALTVNILRATEDRVIGNEDAPITIIEYASLTCPHCAKFHNNLLAQVKRDLVETGRARLIFRDFPIDGTALKAAMMARCAPNDKYFDLIEVLFRNQDKWTKSDNPTKALAQYGNLAGMDDDFIAACMTNKELEDALVKRQLDARKLYRINSTPTFVFNTRKLENVRQLVGPETAQEFNDTVNRLLAAGN
ncbi:MAG: DsbA family protein [Alphaproteobacteria bacterium]|nr:DsbA family protein [Alphaproteobacteria bacterium]